MERRNDQHNKLVVWTVVSLFIIVESILLYTIPRSNFLLTFGAFIILFALYFYVVKAKALFSFSLCISLAVMLRLIAVFSVPELSDDYFRFIWDGQMNLSHINPFQYTPQEFMLANRSDAYLNYLYANMNSQEYHSVYPPVLQSIFSLAALLSPKNSYGSVVVMKLFILAAECITMRILFLYAQRKRIDIRNTIWYILNPMIIIELTGNVHFEGLVICFLIAGLYLLEQKKILFSAVCWALAIATKMLPLMLTPLFLRYMGLRAFTRYGLMAAIVLVLCFLPFYNAHLFTDINASLKLFYHLFEFNGSIFYFIRWIGYHRVHYDIIEETAPVLGVLSFIIILCVSWWPARNVSILDKSMWVFFIYFLFATMVHPWYISVLVLFAAFSRSKFALVFSLLILLSYFPYSLKIYYENNWIIFAEYGLLFAFMLLEYLRKSKNLNPVL